MTPRQVVATLALHALVLGACAAELNTPPDVGPRPTPVPRGEGEGEGNDLVGEGEGEGEGAVVVAEGEGEGSAVGEGEGEGAPVPPPGSLRPGVTTQSIPVLGSERSARVVVPTAVLTQKVPLVIALHDNGGTGAGFIASTGLDAAANARGFVLVAPDGILRDVDVTLDGQTFPLPQISWDAYNAPGNNIDLALIDQLITSFVNTGSIDARRIHLFGYSQGGFLAFHDAIEQSQTIASVVVVSAGDSLNDGPRILAAAGRPAFAIRVGANDVGPPDFVAIARATKNNLLAASPPFVVDFSEVAGASGHAFPVGTGENSLAVVDSLAQFLLAHPRP